MNDIIRVGDIVQFYSNEYDVFNFIMGKIIHINDSNLVTINIRFVSTDKYDTTYSHISLKHFRKCRMSNTQFDKYIRNLYV